MAAAEIEIYKQNCRIMEQLIISNYNKIFIYINILYNIMYIYEVEVVIILIICSIIQYDVSDGVVIILMYF